MAASLALLCLLESEHATIRQKAQPLQKFCLFDSTDSHLSKKVEEKKICQFKAGVCWKEKKKIEVWQNPERRSGRSLCNISDSDWVVIFLPLFFFFFFSSHLFLLIFSSFPSLNRTKSIRPVELLLIDPIINHRLLFSLTNHSRSPSLFSSWRVFSFFSCFISHFFDGLNFAFLWPSQKGQTDLPLREFTFRLHRLSFTFPICSWGLSSWSYLTS